MLLTAVTSISLVFLARVWPEPRDCALQIIGQIDFERLILHEILPLLLFAGIGVGVATYIFRSQRPGRNDLKDVACSPFDICPTRSPVRACLLILCDWHDWRSEVKANAQSVAKHLTGAGPGRAGECVRY